MSGKSWRSHAVVVALLLLLLGFFSILVAWNVIDHFQGDAEVSEYIRKHAALVEKRSADPKVHAFSLSHDPHDSASLLIQFDVEDKATYERLEEDLDDAWDLEFPARWDTNVRSKEDLGNNWGFAAQGMGEVGKAVCRLLIAAAASVALAGLYLMFAPAVRFHFLHAGTRD